MLLYTPQLLYAPDYGTSDMFMKPSPELVLKNEKGPF